MIKLEEIFEVAAMLPPAERSAYLDTACAGQPEIRTRVDELLRSHDVPGFMQAQAAALCPGIDAELARLKSEEAGERIGNYKLLEPIGEGGFGTVWIAEQQEPVRRQVALKVIKLGMDTKDVIARFETERQALAMMDHPNIAKVFDAGATATGRPFFVMELVRGRRVTDFCDQNNLPTTDRLKLFITVCQAVQHAHQKGIIHRDLKPSNILVTLHDGIPVPKVIDFGVAKATQARLTERTLFTELHQMIGTPLYMSPEQAEMSGLDIDTRSDIYSLGVLLYELLAGCTPLDPATLLKAGLDEIRRAIREVEPPKPSTVLGTMSKEAATTVANFRQSEPPKLIGLVQGDLDWIVMKCLEKDRTRRYETASGLVTDIQRHIHHEPIEARPPGKLYRFQKFVRRNRLPFAAAAAVVAALIVGLGFATYSFIREKQAHRDADTSAKKSRQIALFLKDMLASVGPSVALGRDTTILREALDKTANRVGQDLKDQPEIEADLRNTIGEVYQALGQNAQAESMYGEALALRKKVFGEEHPDVAATIYNVATVADSEGRLAEAEKMHRVALEMRKKFLGSEHPDVATSLNHLAFVLQSEGKLIEAETLDQESLRVRRKLFGDEHPDVARSLNNLAILKWRQGDLEEAYKLQHHVLSIRRKLLGSEHPDVVKSLINLALVLSDQRKFDEAEILDREALTILKKLLGTEHPWIAQSTNNLAFDLREQGKLVEAESLSAKALAMQRKLLHNDNPEIANSLNNLAGVLQNLGKLAEAETMHRESLAIREKVYGRPHVLVADSLNDLASVLSDGERLDEAGQMGREALEMRRKMLGSEHLDVAAALYNLAAVLVRQEKPEEAVSMIHECLAIRQKKLPNDWRTFDAQSLMGSALSHQKKYAEAEPLLLSGYDGMKQRESKIPVPAKVLSEAIKRLVQHYEARDQPAEAAKWEQKLELLKQEDTGKMEADRTTKCVHSSLSGGLQLFTFLKFITPIPSVRFMQ